MFPLPPCPDVEREELYPGPPSPPQGDPPSPPGKVGTVVVKLAVSQSGSQTYGVSLTINYNTGSGIVFTQPSL